MVRFPLGQTAAPQQRPLLAEHDRERWHTGLGLVVQLLLILGMQVSKALRSLIDARSSSLLIGSTLFVVCGYVFTHNLWQLRIGPISLTLGRAWLVGMVLLFAVRWQQGTSRFRPLVGCDWLVALLVVYLTIRFGFTEKAPESVASSVSPFWRLIASFWMPAALYFVVRNAELSERAWKAMLGCLTGLGLYLALTGFAEVSGQWWAVFPKYIANPTLGAHFGRARGPALMSASMGVFLTITFWSAWFLWSRLRPLAQLGLLGAMGLMALGVGVTYTRSTWLGLAAGLAVIPLLHFPRVWRPTLLAAMLVAGVLGGAVVGDKVMNISRKDEGGSAAHSVYQRASFLHVSLGMFRDAPLVGHGFGRFYDRKLPYLSDRSQQIELESIRQLDHHNTFLSLLTETGGIGLGLFVLLLVGWWRAAWQLVRASPAGSWMRGQGLFCLAVMIAYLASAIFHDLTLSPSEQWVLYLTAGVTIGTRSLLRSRQHAQAQLEPLLAHNKEPQWAIQ